MHAHAGLYKHFVKKQRELASSGSRSAIKSSWGSKDHTNATILKTMVSGIPIVLGLQLECRILMYA